jgi:hypothetical protein
VVLDNYPHQKKANESTTSFDASALEDENNNENGNAKKSNDNTSNKWVQEVRRVEGHVVPSSSSVLPRIPSWKSIHNNKGNLTM